MAPGGVAPNRQVHVRRWGKLVPSIAPLFPCYLFALMGISSDYSRLKYTTGVRGIVSGGNEPLVVPSSIIDQLKFRCGQGPIELPVRRLLKGQPVVIAEGSLKGFEAIFEQYLSGSQRVALLLSSVSSFRVVLPANSVEPVRE